MPLVRSETKPTGVVYDAWGNIIRADWRPAPGRSGFWDISGETHTPTETVGSDPKANWLSGFTGNASLLQQALADPSFVSGKRSYAAGAPGAQSVNAYQNSLRAQGISPSELPYDSGQIATTRVLKAHNQPIPSYYSPWAAQMATAEKEADLKKALADYYATGVVSPLLVQLGYV